MEINQQFIDAANKISQKYGITLDNSQDTIQYLQHLSQRIIRYEICTSIIWIIIGILGVVLGILMITHASKDQDAASAIGFIFFGGLITVGVQIFNIVTALTLPEKTCLDLLQQFIK